eukprot:CAMPEP_0174276758 /NCGR_PEP_ID=MMETSP0439-20130205/60566_1 /TAXON_ID=0 /ORGANISM="Stereomyxa ramosa, Strain Chinc5" /LENGTH=266 /DNA_ID=CAMNT_0015369023 /DNA_START=783 /DNA_END=1583 /DNA_ORIENTATION=+
MITPTHFDLVHNLYTQIVGQKRFIIFPPDNFFALHVYPVQHPSNRQAQVDINDPSIYSLDSVFPDAHQLRAYEVILQPGDVLYIPPCYFHHVSVVGDSPSISISTHTASMEAQMRGLLLDASHRFATALTQQFDWPAQSLPWRMQALKVYVQNLFPKIKTAKSFTRKILKSRWRSLREDKENQELWKVINEKKEELLELAISDDFKIPQNITEKMKEFASKTKEQLKDGEFQEDAKPIMLTRHIEHFSSILLGPLSVFPFLEFVLL